mmetsp:Transcript_49506/g.130580  ORF Transcript_49506/g.130580 Transcript_49506/m.130580 type:complete len:200 (-) Transcript_49506:139-738(-)
MPKFPFGDHTPLVNDGAALREIDAVAGASSSLGLISTLVFGTCVSTILAWEEKDYEDLTRSMAVNIFLLCMSFGTACSMFTTAFSLLDYYYAQMLRSIDDNMSNREEGEDSEAMRRNLHMDAISLMRSLDHWRGYARNSMWISMVCLICGAGAHIVINEKLGPVVYTALSALAVCIVMVIATVSTFRAKFKPVLTKYKH